MEEVHVKGYPHPLVLEEDGRLDLAPLQLQPASICIQGKASLVGANGFTKRTWAQLQQGLPQSAHSEPLGTPDNPLQVGGIPVAGVSDGRAEASSAVRDRSQEHVKLLLPVGLNPPSLPASSSEVAAWLLRTEDLQIPVTREAYEALQELPRMKELLVPTDGSNVPASLSTLIRHEPGDIRSEEDTARLIGMFFEMVFGLLEKYSTSSLGMQLERNKAENRTQSSSQVLRDSKLRPDATGIAHQATLLLGEDKWASMMAAINDLKRKLNSLSTLHYGPVNFLLAYAAAGTQFKWFFLPQNCADQMVDLVGPATFNLCKADDRARFLLSIVQAYLLLRQMRNALPPVTRRLPLFGKYLKPDSSGSWVMALATAVHKHVPNFLEHVQAVHTSWAAVQEAYAAAAAAAAADRLAGLQRPCIVSVVGEAKLSRKSNNLDVQLQPVGLEPQFKSEQDVSAMTWAACRALAFLHSYGRGICLRDLRRENTVQLGDLEYCMIDLENAAFADQQLPFQFRLKDWTDSTLDPMPRSRSSRSQRYMYTRMSDIHQLGIMVEKELVALGQPVTQEATSFVRRLKAKQLTAQAALADPWLQGVQQLIISAV